MEIVRYCARNESNEKHDEVVRKGIHDISESDYTINCFSRHNF